MPLQLQLDVGLRGGLLYLLLLLAIPLQYHLSNRTSVPEEQREASFRRLMKSIDTFRYKYLSVSSWRKWCLNVITKVYKWKEGHRVVIFDDDTPEGECPAHEVFHLKSPQGYFARSTEIRSSRPPDVKYRVGQVIQHKLWGYRGVIIGWDKDARAPKSWLDQMHPPEKWHWRKMPNYSILVDTADRKQPQMTYVPQENIQVIAHHQFPVTFRCGACFFYDAKSLLWIRVSDQACDQPTVTAVVNHPQVSDYFDSFDGAQYIMRPALKHFYPKD